MEPHPEGGYFAEVFRSDEYLSEQSLPERYLGKRNFFTSIYYLLEKEDFSAFHRLASDEIWNYYDGSALLIHILGEKGEVTSHTLGLDCESGEKPQLLIKRGQWFAAEVKDKSSFTLVGCIVIPGFEYSDFRLGDRSELAAISSNPLIDKLTR